MDRSSKQKMNKETQALHDTLDPMDPTDIFFLSWSLDHYVGSLLIYPDIL